MIVVIILFVNSIYAVGLQTPGDTGGSNLGAPDANYQQALHNCNQAGSTCSAQDFKAVVAAKQVNQIGSEQIGQYLDQIPDDALNQLTADQLAADSNLNKIKDKWGKLNQDELNKAKQQLGIEDGTITTTSDTQGTIDSGKLWMSDGSFSTPTTVVQGAKDITYNEQDKTFDVGYAQSFYFKGSIATNANDIHADPLTFSVGHADSIISGCLITGNIDDSTVTVYGNALQFDAHSSLKASIEDCTDAKTTFTTNGGSLIVGKNNPAIYNVIMPSLPST